ncbi:MAG: putative peptidase [Proteobacteria bacterium]|nr:putative peptidase [Pseudomonadota bacterium]
MNSQSRPQLFRSILSRQGVSIVLVGLLAAVLGACANNGKTVSTSNVNLDSVAQAGGSALKAATLSDSDVKTLSDQSCAEMDKQSKISPVKSKYSVRLAKVVKGMPKSVGETAINYKVYETKDVNAWAMINGCVRVYSGLMDMMSDDELRGVIGHELGHVALGHSKKAMQVAYTATAARQAAGAAGGTIAQLSASQLGDLTEKLVNAQFSQTQETEADDYSFDLLTTAKLKREGLITAFEKLAKLGDSNSMFSSHPSSTGRAQHIRDRIAAKK